jgi:hypothetical protein
MNSPSKYSKPPRWSDSLRLRRVKGGPARELQGKIAQIGLIGFFKPRNKKKRAHGPDCGNGYLPLQDKPRRHAICQRTQDGRGGDTADPRNPGRKRVDDDRL